MPRRRTRMSFAVAPIALALSFALIGCGASLTPRELRDARVAWKTATDGAAVEYAPAELAAAQESLELAERTFAKRGDSRAAREAAYEARLKIDRAVQIADLRQVLHEANRGMAVGKRPRPRQAELGPGRVLEGVRDFARIETDARGRLTSLVLEVPFERGNATVPREWRTRLEQIGTLIAESDPRPIHIVGYTEAGRAEGGPKDLAVRRAQAVADVLLRQGVDFQDMTISGTPGDTPTTAEAAPPDRVTSRRVVVHFGAEPEK